jgi:predicted carbohydrate-binding protein with CBM5 and CBM33 domain
VKIRRLAALAGVVVLGGLLPAPSPAFAHGAPTTPISRTAACASGGSDTGSAACQAARKANGGRFGAFDNLRIANVNGDDRRVVPDGELCSGGIGQFKGLDIARDDFPATKVTGGRKLTIRYRTTIPHRGSFRIYLTRPGYDPAEKLTWADLGSKPLVTVTDPPVRDGAYVMSAKLPTGRTGRHILYVVWETSSTPDTYYTCSDLVFPAAGKASAPAPAPATSRATVKPKAARTTAAPTTATATTAAPVAAATSSAPPAAAPVAQPDLTPVSDNSDITLGHQIIVGAVLLAAGAVVWAAIDRIRRRRRRNG